MSKNYRILSLDGGGIRGVITAYWLSKLEEIRPEVPLRERFDLIAGTSTGSILACGLAKGLKARDIVRLYRERGREVFPGTGWRIASRFERIFAEGTSAPKYDVKGISRVLKDNFGDTLFGDLHPDVLVVAYDTKGREATVMKNTKPEHKPLPVWEVCKASSSAPTYFPAHVMTIGSEEVPLIDGGVVANNPAACAIAEGVVANASKSLEEHIPIEQFVVASFGTGESTRPISAKQAKEWGALEWAIPIIQVLFDGSGDATNYIADKLIPKGRYFRFQTRLDKGYDDMDNTSVTNIDALLSVAAYHLSSEGGKDRLEQLDSLLK